MFSYANYSTYEAAEESVEESFANGDLSPYEFLYIARKGKRWHVMVRG
jgi:hypothetical protein